MICIGLLVGAVSAVSFARNTELKAARLSDAEIAYLKKDLEPKHRMYDPKAKMLRTVTGGKHYHSDLDGGVTVHQTRESLEYAVALLKTGDKKLRRRAVDIIRTVVPMQEKDPSLPHLALLSRRSAARTHGSRRLQLGGLHSRTLVGCRNQPCGCSG